MQYNDLLTFVRETLSEARKTQDKRLSALSNKLTRSIMAIYSGRQPEFKHYPMTSDDFIVDLETESDELYEIAGGVFPLVFDPSTIDSDVYDEGINPFLTVTLEIDRAASRFNVSASDKDIVGSGDIGLHIVIETPVDFSDQQKGLLRDEVANSVRHELEHITQGDATDQPGAVYGRDEAYFTFLHGPDEVVSQKAKYMLKPEEIPAFVRGEAHNVKNIEDLKKNLNRFLDGYIKQDLITTDEKTVVLDTWLDWTEKNIHRKGF